MKFKTLKKTRIIFFLIILFLLYITVFSVLSIKKHEAFNCDVDTENILQAFHNTIDGRLMEMTWNGGESNGCRWRGHTEIIFLFLLPFFAIWQTAKTLLIAQTVAIATGGLAVFLIAKETTKDEKISFLLAITYWLYPYLNSINLLNFHADPFMILPHLLAWYFLKKNKTVLFWSMIILGTLVKEYVCIYNFLFGIMIFTKHKKKAIILIGLSFFQYFVMTPIIGILTGNTHFALNTESHAIQPPTNWSIDFIKGLLKNILTGRYIAKIMVLLAIFNITLYKFKKGLIIVVPLVIALTIMNPKYIFHNHRHTMLIAPLFIILIEGLGNIKRSYRQRYVLFGVLLPTVLITFFFSGGSIIAENISEVFFNPKYRNVFHYKYTKHDYIADSIIVQIPDSVPVASSRFIRSKLVNRKWSFLHPHPKNINRADFYTFDFFEVLQFHNNHSQRRRCAELLENPNVSLISHIDGILLFKRYNTPTAKSPFVLNRVNDCTNDTTSFNILERSILPYKNGFVMHTVFEKGQMFKRGKALVSMLINDKMDTIRVLHTPSYLKNRIDSLAPGLYKEEFFFQIPIGKTLKNRKHQIILYDKSRYLPFFARKNYLVNIF